MRVRFTCLALISIWLSSLAAAPAWADYPDRPVKIVVPFPAGGAVDVIARIVAQKLSDRLHGRFYVENLSGAGGDIGTAAVAAGTFSNSNVTTLTPRANSRTLSKSSYSASTSRSATCCLSVAFWRVGGFIEDA